ncbi:hypothetical protein HYW21_09310 [Candidatus Woesearchaeota archaeon]|nr:hypothetical protein [Candidatus Woesearchaeota archaeon]
MPTKAARKRQSLKKRAVGRSSGAKKYFRYVILLEEKDKGLVARNSLEVKAFANAIGRYTLRLENLVPRSISLSFAKHEVVKVPPKVILQKGQTKEILLRVNYKKIDKDYTGTLRCTCREQIENIPLHILCLKDITNLEFKRKVTLLFQKFLAGKDRKATKEEILTLCERVTTGQILIQGGLSTRYDQVLKFVRKKLVHYRTGSMLDADIKRLIKRLK